MIQFLVWCLPLIFLAVLVFLDLLGMLYDHTAPVMSVSFSILSTLIFVSIVGILYFAVTQFMIFGGVERKTFLLSDMGTSDGVKVYLIKSKNIFTVEVERPSGGVFVDKIPVTDVRLSEAKTTEPRLSCYRFATKFPRVFSGEFSSPSDAASCVAVVPRGAIRKVM